MGVRGMGLKRTKNSRRKGSAKNEFRISGTKGTV